MGVFDYITCRLPLPNNGAVSYGEFQTDSFDWPFMEHYEIREDGTLWREIYDTEDHSDKSAPPGSAASISGMMARVNKRWEPMILTGEVTFDDYSAYFVDGKLREFHFIRRSE